MLPPVFARPPLADGVVRFVGDIVAAVVAETRAQAVDAAEMVIVDYDPLPVVVDPEAALADGAPLLFPDHGSNLAIEFNFGDDPDAARRRRRGRARALREPAGRRGADGAERDPRRAAPARAGSTSRCPTQAPHGVRDGLAGALGLEPDDVRVVAPAVGGGFGAKAGDVLRVRRRGRARAALGRPVKWTETRSENMVAMIARPRPGAARRARAQARRHDRRVAGEDHRRRRRVPGDRRVPAVPHPDDGPGRVRRSRRSSSTSAARRRTRRPPRAYRGAGRPEATAFLERIIDMAADELDIDPVEIRKQNFLAAGARSRSPRSPARTTTSASTRRRSTRRARVAGYDELRAEQARSPRPRRREAARHRRVARTSRSPPAACSRSTARSRCTRTARSPRPSGTSAHGQGHETAFAMIVAGAARRRRWSRCASCSPTPRSCRAAAAPWARARCRSAGSALYKASEEVLAKAKQLAAHLLEASADDIVLHDDGKVGVAGVPARALSWAELAPRPPIDGRPDDWPTDGEAALARASSTSTRARRRSRSARTSRSSRSTPRPGDVELPPPRRGRRLRADPEPAARRRPAARRDRAGRRAGAVRRRRLRRRRQPAHREPHGLRDAERGRVPELRGVEHRDADAAEPARREGHRGVGHDRLDAGGAERGRRRALAPRRPPPRHAAHRRSACGGRSRTPARPDDRTWPSRPPTLRLTGAAPTRSSPTAYDGLSRRGVRPARRARSRPTASRPVRSPRCTRAANADASARTYTVDSRDHAARRCASAEARGERDRRRLALPHAHRRVPVATPTCARPPTRRGST